MGPILVSPVLGTYQIESWFFQVQMLSDNLKLTVLKGPSNSARKPSKICTERCEMGLDLDTKHIDLDTTHMDLHTETHGFVHKTHGIGHKTDVSKWRV